MANMSDDGDRTCPLCAEDMDLTDQQLNPCKCGYEICVWCWHHIMDMAEKDGSEGRCPACRTPYDKQRIVGSAANCKRMVAEISAEKRHKSQKTRNKTSIEDRKHLSNVRVVQRNLVYIMGIPSSIADESVLERKEYFGQYGKILKVSFARQAGTVQQVSCNNTSSVYITYSREEEAVRCIQAVHNFVLEGKPLRACFGTTKYCYTWLRNMICSNPDCLYLHEVGSQEDSFTKDETISAYTRSRVPQISSNNLQPRAGNILPPPVDDSFNNATVSTKQSIKTVSNNTAPHIRNTNDTCGTRSAGLPAAASWGLRASSVASQSTSRQKTEDVNISSSSSALASTKKISAWNDDTVNTSKVLEGTNTRNKEGMSRPSEHLKYSSEREYPNEVPDADHASGSAWDDDVTTSATSKGGQKKPMTHGGRGFVSSVSESSEETDTDEARPSAWDDDPVTTPVLSEEKQTILVDSVESWEDTLETCTSSSQAHASEILSSNPPLAIPPDNNAVDVSSITSAQNSTVVKVSDIESDRFGLTDLSYIDTTVNRAVDNLSLGLSTVNLENNVGLDHITLSRDQSSSADRHLADMLASFSSRVHNGHVKPLSELSSFPQSREPSVSHADISANISDLRLEMQKQGLSSMENGMEDILGATNHQRQRHSGNNNLPSYLSQYNGFQNMSSQSFNSSQNGGASDKWFPNDRNNGTILPEIVEGSSSYRENGSLFVNGVYKDQHVNNYADFEKVSNYPGMSHPFEELKQLRTSDNKTSIERTAYVDKGDEKISSDISSLEFDPWDDTWSSANNFAKQLGQMDRVNGISKPSQSWKEHTNHESRFSFARQENQANLGENILGDIHHSQRFDSPINGSYRNNINNSFSVNNFGASNAIGGNISAMSSDRFAGVSRPVSVSSMFSVPKVAPPPGFSSPDRYDQDFNKLPERFPFGSNHNQGQAYSTGNAGDVEFIDPAILEVGGRLPLGVSNSGFDLGSALPSHFSNSESDRRVQQLLMQQAISANQGLRMSNNGADRFSQYNDPYISSRFSNNNTSNMTPFAQMSHQTPSHTLNGQWDSWNGLPSGNNMGIADVLRNQMFGLNHYVPASEEPKFRVSSSGDLYNRAFGL